MRITGLTLALTLLCLCPAGAQTHPYGAAIAASGALRPTEQRRADVPIPAVDPSSVAAREFSSRAPGATLMIVGGAAVVAGILVGGSGGTVLILGGVGVGAYGVYLYTR